MVDRKEVLDYLRNQQKAAEIEAKVNGINLWVLLGAMAVVGWQLLGTVDSLIWRDWAPILRGVIAVEAGYMLLWFCGSTAVSEGEVRYSSWRITDMQSPFLIASQGLLLSGPPLILLLVERDISVVPLGILGLIFLGMSLVATLSTVLSIIPKQEKFPRPEFGSTRRGDALASAVLGSLFIWIIVVQFQSIVSSDVKPLSEYFRILASVSVLYLLALLVIRRRLHSQSIAWTYDLETELLLETVSAEVALRRIEQRGLGARIQDVMNIFFDELDRRFLEIELIRESVPSKLVSISEIPKEYAAEREARLESIISPLNKLLDEVKVECSELLMYVNRLEEKSVGERKKLLGPHIQALKQRHGIYVERAKQAKSDLQTAIRTAQE